MSSFRIRGFRRRCLVLPSHFNATATVRAAKLLQLFRLPTTTRAQPTYSEMRSEGGISNGVFEKKFGSWIKAVHAFCADRASVDDREVPVRAAECSIQAEMPKRHADHVEAELAVSPALESAAWIKKTVLVDARRIPGVRLRFRVFQRDSFKCVVCGRSPATHPGVTLQADHHVPWSRGGLTSLENLRTLCHDCNLGKSDSAHILSGVPDRAAEESPIG